MQSKTIIYYTANREDPKFEAKIQENLVKNSGGLPIISISQKPIKLGENICVGNVGHSYLNTFRQILIGAKEAKTPYLVFAEADFLYPPEYFAYEPGWANLYRYDNVWVVFKNQNSYNRIKYSNGAQIAKRRFVIYELEKYLKNQPEWANGDFVVKDRWGNPKKDYNAASFKYFRGPTAAVSFKTGRGMTKSCQVESGDENKCRFLHRWGYAVNLKHNLFV